MKLLTSDANASFRRWLRLATAPRAVRDLGQTLAEGLHLAQVALDANWPVSAVLLRRGSSGGAIDRILGAVPAGVERFQLAAALFDRISPVEHGVGLMLVVPVLTAAVPVAATEDLVYLDAIQDPINVGALLRTAAAAGVRTVLCGPTTATTWAPRSMRAAMGAHFRLKISEQVAPEALGPALDGPWIGAVAHQAPSLWACALPPAAVGWVFGSEGAGLSAAARAQCAMQVRIPLEHDTESLNVAAAAAICLFERKRRALGR